MKLTTEAKTLLGIGICTLVLLFGGVFFLSKNSPPSADPAVTDETIIEKDKLIRADSYQTASQSSKLTIVEFLDYECEACGAAHPILKKALNEYGDKVNFVVRHFPNHTNSIPAANAVEAAGEQGKYWEMHNMMFDKQTEWAEQRTPQTEKFLGYAQSLGLNIDQYKTSTGANKYSEKITRDKNEGITIGVDATPTFFINGSKKVGVIPYEEWKKIIDEELSK